MCWHQVQAYTEYKHTPSTSINRVQHMRSTVSTHNCLSSLHSHSYKLTPQCSFSFQRASVLDRPLSASSPWALKGKATFSYSNSWQLTNWWIESPHAARSINHLPVLVQSRSITVCKCISHAARTQCLSVSPDLLDDGRHVHLQTPSITASKCISRLAWLRPASSHAYRLQVHLQTPSITASKFTWS
jgi:hypothetical protein